MRLVEKHIISKSHELWAECDRVCFAAKNLYNYSLYQVNDHYKKTKIYKNYNKLVKELASQCQVDYVRLPAKISQQVLMKLDQNYKSFFASLKDYKLHPEKYKSEPKPPQYLPIVEGRYIAVYTEQAISKTELKKHGFIKLSQTEIRIKDINKSRLVRQVQVVPLNTGEYKIVVIYDKQEPALRKNKRFAGIDIGLNNLAAVVTNTEMKPFIINGRPLKSANQHYNKNLAKQKSELPHFINKEGVKKQRSYSKKIRRLTHKRNCRVDDLLHRASHQLVQELKQANISIVVIGKNKGWKDAINIGGKNNQKFVSTPHSKFIDMTVYKLRMEGIHCITREENHTSKCSFLDGEDIKQHKVYQGKRIKRGLFQTSLGFRWNADCNAAANILKKEIPDAFKAYGMMGTVVSPVIINPYKRMRSHKIAA